MKYEKLVIISTNCLDKRISNLFGVIDLISFNICVEYWNITELTYHEILKPEYIDGVTYIDFQTKKDFCSFVTKCYGKPYLFIVYANYAPATYFCYRALSKINADIAYCVNGVFPSFSVYDRIKMIRTISIRKVFQNRLFSLLKKTFLLKPLTYQFNTCRQCVASYKIGSSTKFIPFNSGDFSLTRKKSQRLVNVPYIVYIDEYLPYHPDRRIVSSRDIDAEAFYKDLRNLFDKLEQTTGKSVIIAAHPVAKSYDSYNPFGGRKIYFFKTKQLIEYCDCVLTHHSTAFAMGVVYKKPILFITSDDIISSMPTVHQRVNQIANILNSPLINMNHLSQTIEIGDFDDNMYNKYLYDYVTNPESENKLNSEIIQAVLRGDYE